MRPAPADSECEAESTPSKEVELGRMPTRTANARTSNDDDSVHPAPDVATPSGSTATGTTWIKESAQRLWQTATHLCMFLVLTVMHALGLFMHKVNANADHSYDFSPASTLVCMEATKFVLATWLHKREVMANARKGNGGPTTIVDSFRRTATLKLWAATTAIAVMYTVNNLLTFFAIAKMDPGKVAIAKATVPYLTAVTLHMFFSRPLNGLQWACIVLQCVGVATTQFKADSHGLALEPVMYAWLGFSIVITTMSSVYNEYIIKKFKAPLQQINMIMYVVGIIDASVIYVAVPKYHEKAFFEGYTPLVGLLILTMSLFGLCVGYAYKYADVLIKNLSTSGSLALLVWLSAVLFDAPLTFTSVAGSVVIITTSYIYLVQAPKLPKAVPKPSAVSALIASCRRRGVNELSEEVGLAGGGNARAAERTSVRSSALSMICRMCVILLFLVGVAIGLARANVDIGGVHVGDYLPGSLAASVVSVVPPSMPPSPPM